MSPIDGDIPLDIRVNDLLQAILHSEDKTKFLVALVQVRKTIAKLEYDFWFEFTF